MSGKVVVLICSIIILWSAILAQRPGGKPRIKTRCGPRSANTTCANLCETYKCVRGSCVCSTPIYSGIELRKPSQRCKLLTRKRKLREVPNNCFYKPEDSQQRQLLCCLHPRFAPEEEEIPEEDPQTPAPEDFIPPETAPQPEEEISSPDPANPPNDEGLPEPDDFKRPKMPKRKKV